MEVKLGKMRPVCLCCDSVVASDSYSSIRGAHGAQIDDIAKQGVLSVDFSATTTPRSLSFSFWEGKEIVKMVIAPSGRDVPVVKSNLALAARLMSILFLEATINSCAGCSSDFIKSLDKSPTRNAGIQYSFS